MFRFGSRLSGVSLGLVPAGEAVVGNLPAVAGSGASGKYWVAAQAARRSGGASAAALRSLSAGEACGRPNARLYGTEAGKEDGNGGKDDGGDDGEDDDEKTKNNADNADAPDAGPEAAAEASPEDRIAELEEAVKEAEGKYLRALAEQETLRIRTRRDVDDAKEFGIKKFAEDALDVADNLERALDQVPEHERDRGTATHPDLAVLYEGVKMTHDILLHVFERNGVRPFESLDQAFDPDIHMAMVEIPDPTRDAGVVAHVMKKGYKIGDRVLRAAEVGVSKAVPGSEGSA